MPIPDPDPTKSRGPADYLNSAARVADLAALRAYLRGRAEAIAAAAKAESLSGLN